MVLHFLSTTGPFGIVTLKMTPRVKKRFIKVGQVFENIVTDWKKKRLPGKDKKRRRWKHLANFESKNFKY